jgi:hypothetical protein
LRGREVQHSPEAKTGDVVTYGYRDIGETLRQRKGLDFENLSPGEKKYYTDFYRDKTGHYSVVLLKTKDGSNVKSVVEKSGTNLPRVVNPRDSKLFIPSKMHRSPANRAGFSFIYRKKQ